MTADEKPVRVLTWDWRGQPDLAALARAVTDLYGGHLAEVNTGSDQYAIVLSTAPLSTGEVAQAWRRRWEDEDD